MPVCQYQGIKKTDFHFPKAGYSRVCISDLLCQGIYENECGDLEVCEGIKQGLQYNCSEIFILTQPATYKNAK